MYQYGNKNKLETRIYVNSPALSGRHISRNVPAKKMLINITHIRSESPALNPIYREHKSSFT